MRLVAEREAGASSETSLRLREWYSNVAGWHGRIRRAHAKHCWAFQLPSAGVDRPTTSKKSVYGSSVRMRSTNAAVHLGGSIAAAGGKCEAGWIVFLSISKKYKMERGREEKERLELLGARS